MTAAAPAVPAIDLGVVRQWAARFYAGAPGHVTVWNAPNLRSRHLPAEDPDGIAHAVEQLDGGDQDVYLSACTLRAIPASGRGGSDLAAALPGVWADIDVAGPTHKDSVGLPPDLDAAETILDRLPPATVVVNTGGGLQPWWLLDESWILDSDEERAAAEDYLRRWGEVVVGAAEEAGFRVDIGVWDLARVMRPPGSLNRKAHRTGLGPVYRAAFYSARTSGVRYTRDELAARFAPEDAAPEDAEPQDPGGFVPPGSPGQRDDGWSAATWVNDNMTWDEILVGWTKGGTDSEGRTYWTRPGKHPRGGHSATTRDDPPVVVNFSSETGLPTGAGRKLTKFRVYAHHFHGGDLSAAAAAITELHGPPRDREDERDHRERNDQTGGAAPADRATPGGTFILDAPDKIPAIWGHGDDVAWAEGEPLAIVGPQGVGKTTIAQQLTLALLGLADEVLGLPVNTADRPVLYIAADRPPQARRSFARMVRGEHRAVLDERLIVWRGPLPFNLATEHEKLLPFARRYGVGTIVIDSLKDVALDLTKDEVGSRVNAALQALCADGREVAFLHHQRKASADNRKPRGLDDVYGSVWITAGCGSVILLWGKPGDNHVELTHLKQPAGDIGPLRLLHEHAAGRTTVAHAVDLLVLARSPGGITARAAAQAVTGTADPDANAVARARRRLDHLVDLGVLCRRQGAKGGASGGTPTTWHTAEPQP